MLIKRSRLKSIGNLALPLMGGLILTNLMGLIDTAMVGQLGNAPLASMGVSNFLYLLVVSVLTGIGTGVQTLVARRMGEENSHLAGQLLNAGLLIAGLAGLLLTALGFLLMPTMYGLVNQDPLVIKEGLSYLRPLIPSMIFLGMNTAFRAYWIGVSLPKWSLLVTVIAVLINVGLNYLLIFGNFGFPRLGTAGAGWATTIATATALCAHFVLGMKHARANGFLQGLPDRSEIRKMIKIAVPTCIRNIYLFLGIVILIGIVGLLSTRELAAFNVVLNVMLMAIMPIVGLAIAALTLVAQAIGHKDIKDAKKWGWEVARLGAGILLIVGFILYFFSEPIIGVFTKDTSTIKTAVTPLRILAFYLWLEAFGRILSSALAGAGAVKVVLVWSLATQWGLSLPLCWLLGVHLGLGLPGIFSGFVFAVIVSTAIVSYLWYNERWSLIKL